MREFGRAGARDFGRGARGERFAEFDAPLIKAIDVPDRALNEHAVLIERHQRAQRLRRETFGEEGVARAIAFKGAVRNQRVYAVDGNAYLNRPGPNNELTAIQAQTTCWRVCSAAQLQTANRARPPAVESDRKRGALRRECATDSGLPVCSVSDGKPRR